MVRRIFLFIIFSLAPLLLIGCQSNKSNIQYISSVHDGDTFKDSNNRKYRLYGVDTPESSNQYDDFKDTKGLERQWADVATREVERLILNKRIIVEEKSEDLYGRIIARIIVDEIDLSMHLVRNGLARVAYIDIIPNSIYFTNDNNYFKKILEIQRKAYLEERGFWKNKSKISIIFPKA